MCYAHFLSAAVFYSRSASVLQSRFGDNSLAAVSFGDNSEVRP